MKSSLLSALLALPLLFGCSGRGDYAAVPPGAAVLAFGDSVTYGTGAPDGADYPARLSVLSGWRIHNAGVPGDTADRARERIAEELQEHRPALVILEIGGNDFLRRRAMSAVKEDIRAMIRAVRAAKAQPVLVAVPAPDVMGAALGGLDDAPIYAELAEEEGVPLVEEVLADVLSEPALRADSIHPNAAGYRKLAEGIADALGRDGLLAGR